MRLSSGTRFGTYEILAPLGAGGMGEVYRARDTRLKRDVAIKVLQGAWVDTRDRLARFEREAELLAALNHPNIAAIYGIEESAGTTALVLELVEGPHAGRQARDRPVAARPEQARGQFVDKRADIWAFGCVLYEMLTARSVFARATVADTMAVILEGDPDWSALPASTPTGVLRLLRRCLDKNRNQRLRDIADARHTLDFRYAHSARMATAGSTREIRRAGT